MAYNYFVAYDLNFPGQNYDAVTERIKSLGRYAHMQMSLFYLQSELTLPEVHAAIREVMDVNDRLAVIWAHDAFISNYPLNNLLMLRDTFQDAA